MICLEIIGCHFFCSIKENNEDAVHEIKTAETNQNNSPFKQKTYRIEQKMIAVVIQDNFWDALKENKISPIMSIELSKIYAWGIDYFGLQKDDLFYIVYEEWFMDSTATGIKRIYVALFNHKNEDFYAIYFLPKTSCDINGQQICNGTKPFLKTPLKYSRISSYFSLNRFHPILKIYRPHCGIDYVAQEGTPVYSVGDGLVLTKGYQKNGAGNYIKIKHDTIYVTQYAHLKSFAKGLKTGQEVSQGQVIGYVGKTGYATGPHLDFRIFKNGKAINPLTPDKNAEEIVSKLNPEEFDLLKEYYSVLFPIKAEDRILTNNSITFNSINGIESVSPPSFFTYDINNQSLKLNQPIELLSSQ
ncbi:MAG: M23 family metallopeptidase [Salinivirgaceae bacterium]|nr:M23 family metallopeptidase [Salinivirgaceae bacterium]